MKFRPRFSLRKLLLFIVAASILSTVVGLSYAQYRHERAIADKLEARGCWVGWRPSWGADFFSSFGLGQLYMRIYFVELNEGRTTTNNDLSQLSDLKNLSRLTFHDSSINDEGLAHLDGCSSLTYLDMKDNVAITDAGLRGLELTNLHSLNVDGTSVTYDGLKWIAKQNPLLHKPTLIGRHAIAQLKQTDFPCHANISSKAKLRPSDEINVYEENSRRQWHDAAEHLREFPGFVIYQFQDLPESARPGIEWGLTLSVVILKDATMIRPFEVIGPVRMDTLPAVAIIPPLGTTVSRLSGPGEIRAWFGEPDWPAKVGEHSLDISGAEIVFVDGDSLPVAVELRWLP